MLIKRQGQEGGAQLSNPQGDQRSCSPTNDWVQFNRDFYYLPWVTEISAGKTNLMSRMKHDQIKFKAGSYDNSTICKPTFVCLEVLFVWGFCKLFAVDRQLKQKIDN